MQILIVGKSINLLRRRCHDNTQLFSDAQRSWFLTETGALVKVFSLHFLIKSSFCVLLSFSLFLLLFFLSSLSLSYLAFFLLLLVPHSAGEASFQSMTGASLDAIVNITYTETSRHLLDILNTKYSFGEHLKVNTMRTYTIDYRRLEYYKLMLV